MADFIFTIQVTKAEEESDRPNSPPPSPGANAKPASALRVSVPSELQGVAYIEVLCSQKGTSPHNFAGAEVPTLR